MNGQPKIRVGVLGATGAVGQRFVQMLQGHPWFELSVLCASPRNAGKRYADACNWLLRGDMPAHLHDIILQEMTPRIDCQLVFSALPSDLRARSKLRWPRPATSCAAMPAPTAMSRTCRCSSRRLTRSMWG